MNRLLLVDGAPLIHAAFRAEVDDHGFRSDGLPTGAVAGYLSRLWDLMREDLKDHRFTHAAIIFDPPGKNWRHDLTRSYKANRDEKPIDMIIQLAMVKQILPSLGITLVEQRGYEADDLIATYVRENDMAGGETVIVSQDKDLFGLIRPGVVMYDRKSKTWTTEADVPLKFFVPPRLVREVQALSGDAVDNVIGIRGIGPKKAAELIMGNPEKGILGFGSIEGALYGWRDAPNWKLKRADGTPVTLPEVLRDDADKIRLAYELVRLDDYVPLAVPLAGLVINKVDAPVVLSKLRALEIVGFARRVGFAYSLRADAARPCPSMLRFAEEMMEWRNS